MATGNSENPVSNILVLLVNPISEYEFGRFIKVFRSLNDLNNYLCARIKDEDNFYLHIPGMYLEKLIETNTHKIKGVRRVHVYYATDDILQSGRMRFQSRTQDAEKLEFHLERDLKNQLENAETGGAVDSSRPIDRRTIDNIATLKLERLHAKRRNSSDCHPPEPKRFAPTVQDEFSMQNIDPRFICSACKIFFQEPYQLKCGHRLCKLCLNIQIRCVICSEFIAKDKAWFDRGFNNEKQDLLTTCLECEWMGPFKIYQEHSNQNHHAFSNYFTSNDQTAQSSLHEQILSALRLVRLAKNSNVHNDQMEGAMSILLNSIKSLNDDIQRMNRELSGYQYSISVLAQQVSSLKTLVQELNDYILGIEINQNLLYQQLLSLKEYVENFQATSFDGTLTWKIKNFQEKRRDAITERQKSIYSPPFYSSQTGYKMQLRLFLNGDSSTRGTHMSLYLVIMKGDYDAIVHWPFTFKVTFTLLNQLQSNNNESKFFWSDPTSSCFQRPRINMNTPYGFSKFFSLNLFEQNETHYVQDDAVFMKVEVDFLAKGSEIPLNGDASELLNDEMHVDAIDDNISAMIYRSDTY